MVIEKVFMKRLILSLNFIFFILLLPLRGQEVQIDTVFRADYLKRSTDFASMTFGIDALFLTGGQMENKGKNISLPAQFTPRLSIGGLHFWGHADFYVHFPVGINLGSNAAGSKNYVNFEHIECGFKYYPIPLKKSVVRPYIGMSFQPLIFKYTEENTAYKYGGAKHSQFISPIQVGLTYASDKYLFSLGGRYNWRNKFDYYITPTQIASTNINQWNFNIGINRYFDSDKNYSSENSVDQLNKKHHILKKENAQSAWYWGFGASTTLQLSKSPYFKNKLPYLANQMSNSFIVPELAFGRYLNGIDMNVNASARYMAWSLKAFDTKVNMNRSSIAFELQKNLFRWRGFVPFVGPSINVDYINFNHELVIKEGKFKMGAGVVFGWDINLTNVETSLLRTSLRYLPGYHLKVNGDKVMFDHLEFNFIQFVKFIGRDKVYKKYRK